MSVNQIKKFLRKEVVRQFETDIKPILSLDKEEGGYFGATKQLMSFVDFLGAMYCGVTFVLDRGRRKRVLSRTEKAEKYIQKILKDAHPLYKENGKLMYKMYRHGLVHLYQPKELLQKNKRILSWAPYKGRRTDYIKLKSSLGTVDLKVPHLQIVPHPNETRDLLPISIACLYEDVLNSIEIFIKKIEKYKKYQLRWNRAVNFLLKPELI